MKASQDTLVGFVSGADDPVLAPLSTRIGERYEILGLLGQGGMGTVYRVRDLHLDEEVALKQLRAGLVTGMLERFRQEVKLARRITHPNVIRIFDLGEADDQHFLTMELVTGTSLARRLRDGRLPAPEALAVVRAVAAGVAAAHRAGVIHCDLKPDNVLIGADRVAVADFGLARAIGAGGAIAGTPAYMAPEQVTGDPLGPATDVYALGAILYEALVGAPAWSGDDSGAVARARLFAPPPDPRRAKPELDAGLAEIVLRCLAVDPAERPDLVAFDAALARVSRGPESVVPRASPSVPVHDAVPVAVLVPKSSFEDASLAATLAEDLVDALGAARSLRVRSISGLPLDLPADPQAAGRRLGAAVVVEGSLRRTDAGVRWSLRAVSAADGYQVWSGRFDAPESGLLTAVEQAAERLGAALAAPLGDRALSAPHDPAVVEAYLQIRALARTTWGTDIDEAYRIAESALASAPDDPLLLACKAQVCANIAFRESDDPDRWIDEGRAAAHRAIARAPLLAEAWLGLARLAFVATDFPAATSALRQALALAPGLARAQEMLAGLLLEVGGIDEAVLRFEAVLAADPTSMLSRVDLARAWIYRRRWDKADALLADVRPDPASEGHRIFQLARLAMWRGPMDPAGPPIPADSVYIRDPRQRGFVSFVLRWRAGEPVPIGDISEAAEWGKALRSARFRLVVMQVLAEAAAVAGRPDVALELVRAIVEEALLDVQWMDHAPMFTELRALPEWPALRAPVAARAEAVRDAIAAG